MILKPRLHPHILTAILVVVSATAPISWAGSGKPDTSLKKITFLETNNLVYSDRYMSVYLPKSPADPEMRKLRDYVAERWKVPVQMDPDILFGLTEWVSMSWRHDQVNAAPQNSSALQILELGRAGKRFRCQEYAQVLHEVFTAFGYVSRVVQIRKVDAAYAGLGAGHVAVEVYSNTLQKWLFLDPQTCSFITKSDNVPLSFYEIYQTLRDSTFDSVLVHTSPRVAEREGLSDVNEFAHSYKMFLRQYFGYEGVTSIQSGERVELRLKLDGKLNYLTFQGIPISHRAFTDDPAHLYFGINKTIVLFDYDKDVIWSEMFKRFDIRSAEDYLENMSRFAARPDFELTLRNSTPWFSHYQVSIDNGPWVRVKGSSFRWSLKDGDNVIRVRSVNAAGIVGPETFARIRYAIDVP